MNLTFFFVFCIVSVVIYYSDNMFMFYSFLLFALLFIVINTMAIFFMIMNLLIDVIALRIIITNQVSAT